MKRRCSIVSSTVTLITTTPNEAARPRSEGYCTSEKISVGIVRMPLGAASASGTSNSPALVTNTISAPDSSAGSSSGMVMWRSVYQNDAPCTRAASSSAASIWRIGAMTKR